MLHPPRAMDGTTERFRLGPIGVGLVLLACCIADLFLLRTVWGGRRIVDGQFRRGYYERFGGEIGLAMDGAIRPPMVPSYLLTWDRELAAQPGMVTVVPIEANTGFELRSGSARAPFAIFGTAANLSGAEGESPVEAGEARLVDARTLSLQDGRLVLVAWDAAAPWHIDEARLGALRRDCAADDGTLALSVAATANRVDIRLGTCVLPNALEIAAGSATVMAALSGPEWMRMARTPEWIDERPMIYPLLAAAIVTAKVTALYWGAGLPSAVIASLILTIAAIPFPVPATLTWPLMLFAALAAAILRAAALGLRMLPPRLRPAIALALIGLAGGLVAIAASQHLAEGGPNWGAGAGAPEPCAIIGYSTVEDQGLRRERGGIRWILNEDCDRCSGKTSSISFGGATLTWARDSYCGSVATFGANGHVIFLGGANDDFLSGAVSLARIFVLGQQRFEPWRHTEFSAVAATRASFDVQADALRDLVQCATRRSAHFLFLHDFVVTDLVAGRDRDRAAMLQSRREIVEGAGGTFVDLLDVFSAEVGIAWFNDYVHPSRVAHEKIAKLACRRLP